jgi:hypothetical protein
VLATMFLTSCTVYSGTYQVELQGVESPENSEEQFGKTKIVNLQEGGITKYSYEDSLIKIIWLPERTQFSFNLTNKSSHSIRVMWDEAVYVNVNGESQKVFHSGVKFIDRNNSQPPTIVVKGASISDVVIPTDNVYYVKPSQYSAGGWQVSGLFITSSFSAEEMEKAKSSYVGKTVKVLLPIRIENTNNEYLFSFKIENFKYNTK